MREKQSEKGQKAVRENKHTPKFFFLLILRFFFNKTTLQEKTSEKKRKRKFSTKLTYIYDDVLMIKLIVYRCAVSFFFFFRLSFSLKCRMKNVSYSIYYLSTIKTKKLREKE